jgi:hypothetical protein
MGSPNENTPGKIANPANRTMTIFMTMIDIAELGKKIQGFV